MVDPSTGAVIVFNGEIYNYKEIKQDLEAVGVAFTGYSDTEVLLRMYATWGKDCVARLNGMWAFAVWDPRNGELFLSRDRFGVKPLYYAETSKGFMFSSEPKALIALDASLAQANPNEIARFLLNSSAFSGEETFFRGIKSLPAGHNMSINARAPLERVVSRYWEYPLPASPQPKISQRESAAAFAALLEDAVRLRLRSDVPVGLTLSGGLDSTAILAAARKLKGRMVSYTAVFGGARRGEEYWARIAADKGGAELVPVSSVTEDWLQTLTDIVWHMDAPSYSPAVFPLWSIARAARENGTLVLLEGQGADELMAGYVQHFPFILAQARLWKSPARLSQTLRGAGKTFGAFSSMGWLGRTFADPVYASGRVHFGLGRLLKKGPAGSATSQKKPSRAVRGVLFRNLIEDHGHSILPALLQYGDAVTMAHGVESRLPFMDYRLVEWVFREQPDLMEGGWTKAPIRAYLKQEGYSKIAVRRDKNGFSTPLAYWLSANQQQVNAHLLDSPNSEMWDFVDRERVVKFVRRSLQTGRNSFAIYKLLTLQIWFRHLATFRKLPTINLRTATDAYPSNHPKEPLT